MTRPGYDDWLDNYGNPGIPSDDRPEYMPVEHDGGTVHALNLSELDNDRPLWRNTPVCGTATGVSSDEAGPESVRPELQITCWECLSIIE